MLSDVHDKATRSRNMAAILGANTKPEMIVRRALHARGFRYKLHDKYLPGKPDLVFPKSNAVLFVNGCFWHGHDCPGFRWPSTRAAFWRGKIKATINRDIRNRLELQNSGWRVGTVWECALKGKHKLEPGAAIDRLTHWLATDAKRLCLRGN